MSIKFSITRLSTLVCLMTTAGLFAKNSFAWDGYDNNKKVAIEVMPGVSAAIGHVIRIFDYDTNSYHEVEIISMDSMSIGTKMTVKDYETDEERVFDMER
jgi:hypothetical protein